MAGPSLYKSPLKKKEKFEPHDMHDKQKAKTHKEHLELKEKGYGHTPLKKKDCTCWKGHSRVPGTKPCGPGSCKKNSSPAKHGLDPKGEKPHTKFKTETEHEEYHDLYPTKDSPTKMRKTTKGKNRTFRTPEEGAGMTSKGVAAYKKENPGSNLKTAVTGKVKPGSKSAGRRKSFCARSKSWTGERGKAARARWKC